MKAMSIGVACTVCLVILGCDQIQNKNRYELGKDASGNTVRLDKRTGEIAIIKDDQIRTLKDAAQADAERKARLVNLEEFKPWNNVDAPNIGAPIQLSTSWRDGKLYYNFTIDSLDEAKALDAWRLAPKENRGEFPKADPKQLDASVTKAGEHRPFTVELNDKNGFKLAAISIVRLARLVDYQGLAGSLEDKDTVPMSEEDYRRISSWQLKWRP